MMLFTLHELAYDLGNFVKVITWSYCHLWIKSAVESILNTDSQLPQLLSYDTTFQLGDFYVSPLLCRQVIFKNSPVMPVLFLIHERKFQEVHQVFMQHVAKNLPSLVEGGKKLVTDEEVG